MSTRQVKPEAYPQTGVANTCRSYQEYMDMFRLDAGVIGEGPVLDVAGGASSFTAQLHGNGIAAVAADPFYGMPREEVLDGARREIGVSSAKLSASASSYDWSYYGSPERHRELREASFGRFAHDFCREGSSSRYVAAMLPKLPFGDGTFKLALCSHFLFLYADTLDENFHRESLAELLRVVRPGGEVRIYPLVSLKWEPYAYLPNYCIIRRGCQSGFHADGAAVHTGRKRRAPAAKKGLKSKRGAENNHLPGYCNFRRIRL